MLAAVGTAQGELWSSPTQSRSAGPGVYTPSLAYTPAWKCLSLGHFRTPQLPSLPSPQPVKGRNQKFWTFLSPYSVTSTVLLNSVSTNCSRTRCKVGNRREIHSQQTVTQTEKRQFPELPKDSAQTVRNKAINSTEKLLEFEQLFQ